MCDLDCLLLQFCLQCEYVYPFVIEVEDVRRCSFSILRAICTYQFACVARCTHECLSLGAVSLLMRFCFLRENICDGIFVLIVSLFA